MRFELLDCPPAEWLRLPVYFSRLCNRSVSLALLKYWLRMSLFALPPVRDLQILCYGCHKHENVAFLTSDLFPILTHVPGHLFVINNKLECLYISLISFSFLLAFSSADDYSVTLLRELVTCWSKQPRVCSLWLYIFFLQKQILCTFFSFSSEVALILTLSMSFPGSLEMDSSWSGFLLWFTIHNSIHGTTSSLLIINGIVLRPMRMLLELYISELASFQGIHACISCCPFFLCNNKLRQCQLKCSWC